MGLFLLGGTLYLASLGDSGDGLLPTERRARRKPTRQDRVDAPLDNPAREDQGG